MLEVIDQKIAEENLSNIRTVLTEEYDFKLEEESVSYAFMCTVLHEVADKNRFINEGKRILTEGGKLAILYFESYKINNLLNSKKRKH